MATKKTKKKAAKKKVAKKRNEPARKAKAVKRAAAKKNPRKSSRSLTKISAKKTPKKVAASRKSARGAAAPKKSRKRVAARRKPLRKIRGRAAGAELASYESTRGGPDTGGQSGDTQGLSGMAETDSESVKELLEEGQAYEAEVVGGVESVPDADQGPVRMHEVPEDDVPEEYLGEDAQK